MGQGASESLSQAQQIEYPAAALQPESSNKETSMKRVTFMVCVVLLAGSAGASIRPTDSALRRWQPRTSLLTAAQCQAAAVGDQVAICHRTSSAVNPYVLLHVSTSACINGHGDHTEDFVAVDGGCADVIGGASAGVNPR